MTEGARTVIHAGTMEPIESRDQHSLDQLRLLNQLSANPKLTGRDALFLTTQLVLHGAPQAERAIARLAAAIPHPSVQEHAAMLGRVDRELRALPHRERVLADPKLRNALYQRRGYILTRGATRPDKLLVVFTTMYNNFDIANPMLHALLLEFGVSILMVKDCTPYNYLKGVSGLGDTIETIAAGIVRIAAEIGARDIYYTGFSSGSYGSLYAALLTGCAGWLGFAAVTDLSTGSTVPPPKFFDTVTRGAIDPAWLRNLRPMVEEKGAAFRGSIYTGDTPVIDLAHARNMAGLDNVDVVELPRCSHSTPLRLIEEGRFRGTLSELLQL